MIGRAAWALFVVLLLAPATARAETGREREACTYEAFRRCGEFIPSRQQVYQCLVKKVRLLNPTCRQAIAKSEHTRQ